MVYSMTGFGRAENSYQNKKITVEIRSLNSKQTDINFRIHSAYKEKELVFRKLVANKLYRGKIDVSVYIETNGETSEYTINKALFLDYYHQLKGIEETIKPETNPDYLQIISRFPDVLKAEKNEIDDEEFNIIEKTLSTAIEALNTFRKQEGASLQSDITRSIRTILDLLTQITPFEQARIDKIKQRIVENFTKKDINYDDNRLEQELIYYIEKLDVSEEKVRLQNHCDYFLETLKNEFPCGKKLGFIAQEIGREINTLGSKASESNMQKIVVQMKDELEKIKEQILNIL